MPTFLLNPQAWKLNPPQSFKTPKNYIEWKKLMSMCEQHIQTTITSYKDIKQKPPEFNTMAGMCLLITDCIGKSIPPVCISENFIEALLNTEVKPIDVPYCAFKNFIFLFPLKYKFFSTDNTSNFVFAFVRVTEDIINCVLRSDNMITGGTYQWSDPFNNQDLNFNISKEVLKENILFERLIKNAILAYTYEPKYVLEEKIVVSAGKGFGEKTEEKEDASLPIRWLGKTFKAQQTKYVCIDSGNKISNRTVKSHWRKGHWHTVCSGVKRKKRNLRWFKPVFVNAN